MCVRSAPPGDRAGLDDVLEKPQVGEVESHGFHRITQPSAAA